jgi:hypothetical protein
VKLLAVEEVIVIVSAAAYEVAAAEVQAKVWSEVPLFVSLLIVSEALVSAAATTSCGAKKPTESVRVSTKLTREYIRVCNFIVREFIIAKLYHDFKTKKLPPVVNKLERSCQNVGYWC